MNQHKLYRTIQSLTEERFRTDEQLLSHVLQHIITNDEFPIKGGRIWKLEPASGTYRLLRQYGDMEFIDRNFRIRADQYPPFRDLHKRGTILATETNRYLRRKGIRFYSATGIGEKTIWKGVPLFQYVLGINADFLEYDRIYALNIIGNALTVALKKRQIEKKAELLAADLDKAREIQRSILPEHQQRFGNYDLYGVSLPEQIVGGDFFDYLHTADDKDRLGVVIADAASKGMSAAVQALYVSGALRMGVEYQTKLSSLITKVNQLVGRAFSPEHFISMVYVELTDSDRGLVLFVNAGHNAPILLRAGTDQAEMLQSTGHILGPFPNARYRADFTLMNKNDLLLLYTDGIVEASNERQEMYGEGRLLETLRAHRTRQPKEICQLLLEDVQVFSRNAVYSDDKTLVVIKRTK